jgi:hypothetical protein
MTTGARRMGVAYRANAAAKRIDTPLASMARPGRPGRLGRTTGASVNPKPGLAAIRAGSGTRTRRFPPRRGSLRLDTSQSGLR